MFNFFKPKTPEIRENTVIVWEPCSKSHSEIVPGYSKYFLDLGYHVSVLVEPKRLKEGLFCRFNDSNLTLNKMSRRQILKFFKESDLSKLKGVMVTTCGKLCDNLNYEKCFEYFNNTLDRNKIFLVEHKVKASVDNKSWREKNITLKELDYEGAKSVAVNPHYFGEQIKITPKNQDIVNFVTIGAIRDRKKNTSEIIDAVKILDAKGINNFKITVIGKGKIEGLPKELRKYFDLKGHLPFDKMYEAIEEADFLLTSYDDNNPEHTRYIQYQTSGNFQLAYGFLKPIVLIKSFGKITGFNSKNSILYKTPNDLATALEEGIKLSKEDYQIMQDNLKNYVEKLYKKSLKNLKGLINE